MNFKRLLFLSAIVLGLGIFQSCTKIFDEGCTDPSATNYDASAITDDGSCVYSIPGCTDPTATNFNPNATVNDGSCIFKTTGQIVFWQYAGHGYGPTTVFLDGKSETITTNLPTQTPPTSCNTCPGCAHFTLQAGTYNYTAQESGGSAATWSGQVTIKADGCLTFFLHN